VLGLTLKEGLGDKDRELDLVDLLLGPLLLQNLHNSAVDVVSISGKDRHALYRVSLIHNTSDGQDGLIPLVEVVSLRNVESLLGSVSHRCSNLKDGDALRSE
jgi:hypothetical protein